MAEERKYMTINMGPQHPATHGVLRLLLELDGEIIIKATPFIGYLHRGVEKLAEAKTYQQALTLTDRLDYTNGLSNNLAYSLACEKLLGLEVPKRGQYLRVILAELQRIAAHLIWLGTHALDIGAMTVLFYAFRERETILEIVEHVTGARLTPSFIRPGGIARDVPEEFEGMVKAFVKDFPRRVDEYETLLTQNVIWKKRTRNVGRLSAEDAMSKCDVLLMVGTSFPYLSYLPKPGQATGIQIEHNPGRMGLRYPVEVGLLGDARLTLQALRPMLDRKKDRRFLKSMQEGMKNWWELMADRETRDSVPLKPQVVAKAVSDFADDDAIISTDSGTITTWIARHHRIRGDQMFSCSGNLATMAPGLPYAIGAKAAYPDRQSIAFVGDGGLTMLMGELATAVKYNLPVKVIVIKNNVLGQIKWEQIVFLGNPEYVVDLHPIDFVKVAEACGAAGYRVDRPEDVNDTVKRAFESDRPTLVEAVVDPNEPPMPPKIRAKQAIRFSEALLRGQPEGPRIALTLFRDRVDELIR